MRIEEVRARTKWRNEKEKKRRKTTSKMEMKRMRKTRMGKRRKKEKKWIHGKRIQNKIIRIIIIRFSTFTQPGTANKKRAATSCSHYT